MGNFTQRITRIQGLSDRRRLPRLGIIRLGIKAQNKKGATYPKETEYFVCPPEVMEIYGDRPTELDVMLPLNEIDDVFPQAYKHYGSSKGLKCQGDGQVAYCVNPETKEMEQRNCPCDLLDQGKCKQSGTLMVMLPKVSVGGIYQIRTSSFNSIVDVNSGLDYVSALVGRFAMIPLKLRRVKTETHHDDQKQNHYTLQIVFDVDIATLNQLKTDNIRVLEHPRYQLPAPEESNPENDPVDIVEDEENLQKPIDAESHEVEDPVPLTGPQMKKIRAMIGEKDDLSSDDKKECYDWIKKNRATTAVVQNKTTITTDSAKDIIDKFPTYYSDWIEAKLGSVPEDDIPF